VYLEGALHDLILLGTSVQTSIQKFGRGLAPVFFQGSCKQARNLRHFSGRKEAARTTEAGAASTSSI
jgi:hypothetical protein